MDNYKEHLEKSWSEKKDQFGGRQKGKRILLIIFTTDYPHP